MMKHYFILIASMLLSDIGCYGQQVTTDAVTVERLHAQVRNLEQTVMKLLSKIEEMKTTKSVSVSTDRVDQNVQNDMPLSPFLPGNLAEGGRSNYVSADSVAHDTQKRTSLFPSLSVNQADGLTLADRSNYVGDEVGFTFWLTKSTALTSGTKILFDTKVENIGNAFDANSGEFVCPVSGTYLFALNIVCYRGSYIEAAIEVNSGSLRQIFFAACDHLERPSIDEYGLYCGETQNGGTAIVKLNQGDRVYVKMIWPLKTVSTIGGNKLSSFSGYLLRPS